MKTLRDEENNLKEIIRSKHLKKQAFFKQHIYIWQQKLFESALILRDNPFIEASCAIMIQNEF